MLPIAPSQAPAPAPAGGDGFLAWLAALAERPGVVETLLALLVVGTAVLVWLRLCKVVDGVRSRAAIEDYLLGVEQALALDLEGAQKRLQKVLDADPENHYARLLFGQVLAQRGEIAQAHKHHHYLKSAFAVESVENELRLAQALLQSGRAQEAADAAAAALQQAPQHAAVAEFLFRARLQAGELAAAATAGQRLLELAPNAARAALRREVAAVAAQAGAQALQRGQRAAAEAALQQARALRDDAPEVRLLAAQLDADQRGLAAATQALLAPPAAATQLPAVIAARAGELALAHTSALPALAPLLPAERWRCAACQGPLLAQQAWCPRCGKVGAALATEPQLFELVAQPGHLADAIEENEAHIRRTVAAALQAPAEAAGDGARAAALALGEKGVHELLRQACHSSGESGAAAIALLQRLGPGIIQALFAASERIEDARLLPIGGGAVAAVVGRVIQGFDRTALPHVEALFVTARPATRKVLIDYFLGLADPQEFQLVLEHFPPLEILDRLNKVDGPVLRRFLQALPARHFVVQVLLLEPAFEREDEVLAAIPGAQQPAALEQVLVQRGPVRSLLRELLTALADAELGAVALRVLTSFGERALDQALSAFVDRERDPVVRARLGEVLAAMGHGAVERLCASFGPEPAASDDDLRSVLERMGDAAVPALRAAYARPSLLERLTVGLFGKSLNRRTQIARALQAIGTARAAAALRDLREDESDPNLKLRLQQALHRLDEQGLRPDTRAAGDDEQAGGRHGQVG